LNAQQISHRRLQLEIRRLTIQDLSAVMLIEPIAFGTHHWSQQSFENELSNPIGYYFAGIDRNSNELVGYSGFWLIDEDEAHITILAVHPSFRRQYVGERLLINNILEARSRGARRMTLEVRVSNQQAQNLYQKYGFKNSGMRRNYYQDNSEDALVLWTDNIETPQFNKLLENRMAVLEPFVLAGTPQPLSQLSKSK
jgi:[ribosomal protein S18]-alanine N-acetyltransferase